jgi:hypothetical protein
VGLAAEFPLHAEHPIDRAAIPSGVVFGHESAWCTVVRRQDAKAPTSYRAGEPRTDCGSTILREQLLQRIEYGSLSMKN